MLFFFLIVVFFGLLDGDERNAHGITCADNNPCLNRGVCSQDPVTDLIKCTCPPDFGGAFCQIAQPCTPDPCKNGATCKTCQDPNGCGGGYTCVCLPGFNGVHCECHPCDPNPCQNGGTCSVSRTPKDFVCACPVPYAGKTCTVTCSPDFCHNGGKCGIRSSGSKYCNCPSTHTGAHCDYLNYCTNNPNPCQNGGTCTARVLDYTAPINSMSDYCCYCGLTHVGHNCETPGCTPDNCVHGTCTVYQPVHRNIAYACPVARNACRCPFPWFGNLCQYPNHCTSIPCQNGGICYPKLCDDGVPDYYCKCRLSYGGKNCEKKYAAECRSTGDPHLFTFDGLAYSNQATCRQILVKTCTNAWPVGIIPTFQIWVENRKCWSASTSCVWRIGFDIYGQDIIMQNDLGVTIDHRDGNTPEFLPIDRVICSTPPCPFDPLTISVDKCDPLRTLAITYRGHNDPWDAPNYEMVVYLGDHRLFILLSHNLAEVLKPIVAGQAPKLCGLCGDFDRIPGNDFTGRPFNSLSFLDTFLVKPLTPAGCEPYLSNIHGSRKKRAATDPPKENEPCIDEAGQALGKEMCAIMIKEDGPFGGKCFTENLNRQKMYEMCVNDVCYNATFFESHLEALHMACGKHMIEVGDWRKEVNLPHPCLSKQVYKRCLMRQCIPTCRNSNPCPDPNWRTECQEGCECVEGTIWDDVSNACIPPSKCNTTKPAFPSGFTGMGGSYYKSAVFKCCEKTEEELGDMIYCQRGEWCFPEGAKLVLAPKKYDYVFSNVIFCQRRSCHWKCEGRLLECMENGKWNSTHLNRKQENRSLEAQLELRKECELCAQDNCTDFQFLYLLEGEQIKNCTKEEEGERLCGQADADNNVQVKCKKRKDHSGEEDHSGEHSKGKGHAYGLNKSSWKSNEENNKKEKSEENSSEKNEESKENKIESNEEKPIEIEITPKLEEPVEIKVEEPVEVKEKLAEKIVPAPTQGRNKNPKGQKAKGKGRR